MNDAKSERLDDPQDLKLLEDLGRWVREQDEAAAERDEPVFEPFPDERIDELVDRALRAQDARPTPDPLPSIEPSANSANDGGRLLSLVGTLVAAAAVAAIGFVGVGRWWGSSDDTRAVAAGPNVSEGVPDPAGAGPEPLSAKASRPAFASVRIEGGGPLPAHQGQTTGNEPQAVCLGRPMQLTIAVTKGQRIDPAAPLELSLEASPPWGSSHRFVYELPRDERFTWVDDGQALVFSGTLEQLASLTPGPWTLQLSAGAPGTCSRLDDRSGCTSLKVRTIEVVAQEGCDAHR